MAETEQKTTDKREYIVDGFSFLSEEDAAVAREELKKARYLKRHLDYQGADMILQLYRKALEERSFQTPVGLAFVNELRERLIEEGVEEFEIEPIPVYYDVVQNKMRSGFEPKKKPENTKKEMTKLRVSVIVNVILALLVASMFFVALTGNNPNILFYRNAILNEYSAWEQELTDRENVVREREQELGIE